MSTFTTDPTLKPIGLCPITNRQLYELQEDLIYTIGYENSPLRIVVPKGFKTDLATSPRFMWWYIKPEGPYNNSTILHDFCYTIQVDRAIADGLLRESLRVLKISVIKRNLMFYAVRFFGWYYYNKAKQECR